MGHLTMFIKKHKVDVVGLSETNVDWRTVHLKDTMWGRLQGTFEHKINLSVGNNTRSVQRTSSYQAGGTAVLATNGMAQGTTEVGQDSRRLGRWSWIRFLGKNGVNTRIISVYCASSKSKKGHTTYKQQMDYFLERKMTVCPIKQFWVDLKHDIQTWIDAGDQIVIGGDWNHPISKVNDHLKDFHLSEAITSKHGLENAPNTSITGSAPIDGIYTSSTLQGVSCGYLPFFKGEISPNHRPIWIDLKVDALLGFTPRPISHPNARRLKNKDPRVRDRYNELLHQHCLEHKIYEKAEELLASATYPLSEKAQKEFAKLDHQRCNGMRMAESRCRKLRAGVYAWSPEFTYCRKLISFWTLMVKRSEGTKIHNRRLLRLLKHLNFSVQSFDMSLEECKKKLDAAWDRYKKAKLCDKENRIRYLEELARVLADSDDEHKIASKLRALIHCEEQRRIAKAIKYTTKRLFSSGTTKVLYAPADGPVQEITEQCDLEKVIIAENTRKYHRTEAYCPLLAGALRDDIGLCGEGPQVDAILNGTYVCPPGTPEGVRLFLAAMKKPVLSEIALRKASFTSVEEFAHQWKRAKETSSSCGTLHYGHYKAGCQHPTLVQLHYTMAQISLESGCYLARHRQGIDVMLLKKEGDYRLHRLRTICLFDAEFNMNNGRVGKAGLDAAISSGDMCDEQYSRPCRGSLDHVVNRMLSFNYFIYHRKPFGLCSCDLAGNYDRIVHAAASLALQRVGVPRARVHGMFDTIQRLIKKVRTAYGDSKDTYGGDDVEYPFIAPPQGVYQGNRNGPPVWSIISSTVFAILRKKGFGVKFITALSHKLFHLCGFAFVDDSDLIHDGSTVAEVSDSMQKALKLWEQIMQATGQAMAPEKSWWYLIDFVWTEGKWEISDGGERTDLIAHDSTGKAVKLTRLLHDQATKMLGVYLSPDGNMDGELAYLLDKAKTWADYIRCGHLAKKEVWVALSTYIWKTITYPLAATTFTETELNSLIWPILDVALPRMDVNRTIAKCIRYGPTNLGGLGIVDPYLEQGIRKIEYLIEQIWKMTPTGFLIRACIESLTLEAGIFGNLLEQKSFSLQWVSVPNSWIQSVWEFISSKNITICNIPDVSHFSPSRFGDMSLMSKFHDSGYSADILQTLNRCRMHLRVVSLSDIATADGLHLHHSAFPRTRQKASGGIQRNNYDWPPQPSPPQQAWTLWRDCLIECFCKSDAGELISHLGDWIEFDKDAYAPTWDWYATKHGTSHKFFSLRRYRGGQWYVYGRIRSGSRRQSTFSSVGRPTSPPDSSFFWNTYRVDVKKIQTSYHITSQSRNPLSLEPMESSVCSRDSIEPQPLDERLETALFTLAEATWLLQHLTFDGNLDLILQSFLDGTLACVSDGSYHIESQLSDRRLSSWNLVMALPFCGISPPDHNISVWEIVMGCDGKGALSSALAKSFERLSSRSKHFDMISAIMGYWRRLPCESFPVHIQSHLDEIYDISSLSRLEQMNVAADRFAKDYLTLHRCNQYSSVMTDKFQFALPVVKHQGRVMCTSLYRSLHTACTRQDILSYWIRKWNLTDEQVSTFTWTSFQRAMGGLSRHKAHFVTKWLSRQTSLGTRKRGRCHLGKCPRCPSPVDDESHCLRCPKIRVRFNVLFEAVCEGLEQRDTYPDLVAGIRICTELWLHPSQHQDPYPLLTHLDAYVCSALCEQFSFGWLNFLQGLHFTCITDIQSYHFYTIKSQHSVDKWHSLFLRELWSLIETIYYDRIDAIKRLTDDFDPTHEAIAHALTAARTELSRGIRTLPVLYHQYFRNYSNSTLGDIEPLELHHWLKTIRLSREAQNDAINPPDCFSPTGEYRDWLLH